MAAAGTDALAHVFRPGSADGPALLALHGTGGDELDMLPLASAVAPGAPVLSPRGAVREGAANRWFRRFAEGVFDLDDLRRRAADLAAWIAAAREEHRDALGGGRPLVALGYSNGANIAAATLLAGHRGAADAVVLLRAQHTLDAAPGLDLRGLPVLLVSGAADPVVPAPEAARLAAALRDAGASVAHETTRAGHGLGPDDVALARRFLSGLATPPD